MPSDRLTIRLPAKMLGYITRAAKREKSSKSDVVRRLIEANRQKGRATRKAIKCVQRD